MNMVIVWAIVIAAALLLELVTYDLITSWFSVGGLAALFMAAIGVNLSWQIVVFFIVSLALLLSIRPIIKKFLRTPTVPTNADINVGKNVKLLSDVADGKATIKLNDIVWTVECDDNSLRKGDTVVITGISGNKFLVKKGGN